MMNPLLIILDIDETLVHATNVPTQAHWDFEIGEYKVFKRPHLDWFLESLLPHFHVAVWSSASDDYVNEVVEEIFPKGYPLQFVWARSRCTPQSSMHDIEKYGYFDYQEHMRYRKILKKVKKADYATLERMLIIDDTPAKSSHNYGNAIYPRAFTGNLLDDELRFLLSYLLKFKEVENVRTIEKRGWRNNIEM